MVAWKCEGVWKCEGTWKCEGMWKCEWRGMEVQGQIQKFRKGWLVNTEVSFHLQLGGMGERCKLPHRGLGRSPRSQCHLSSESNTLRTLSVLEYGLYTAHNFINTCSY